MYVESKEVKAFTDKLINADLSVNDTRVTLTDISVTKHWTYDAAGVVLIHGVFTYGKNAKKFSAYSYEENLAEPDIATDIDIIPCILKEIKEFIENEQEKNNG